MRGVFLYYDKIDKDNLKGIEKKVIWQIENFNNNGLDCRLIELVTNRNTKYAIIKNFIIARIPFGNAYPTWKYSSNMEDLDYLYFRRPATYSFQMIRFLKKIRKNNPSIKIIMEIPTYPYHKEMVSSIKLAPLYLKDLYNRSKLKNYIDRIVIVNYQGKVFGIETINIVNGINLKSIKIKTPAETNSIINICAVATLEPWDGYERIFRGISEYYKKTTDRNIIIHIAGSGVELLKYKKIVYELGIENYVIFYGRIIGQELENVYNKSDLALDVFGMFKKNVEVSSSLKSREYLAKGIPIIAGCKIDIIDDNFKYVYNFENNDSTIDFDKIIEFHANIYGSQTKSQVANEIREYGIKVCDINHTMKDLIGYLIR